MENITDDKRHKLIHLLNVLIFEISGNVFIKTLECLSPDSGSNIKQSISKLDKDRSKRQTYYIEEERTLREVTSGKRQLEHLDVNILLKLIRDTCDVSQKDSDYSCEYSGLERHNYLEHCLGRIKKFRNETVHEYRFLLDRITEEQFWTFQRTIILNLLGIIDKVCEKTGRDMEFRDIWKEEVRKACNAATISTLTLKAGTKAARKSTNSSKNLKKELKTNNQTLVASDRLNEIFLSNKNHDLETQRLEKYITDWNCTHPLPPSLDVSSLKPTWFALLWKLFTCTFCALSLYVIPLIIWILFDISNGTFFQIVDWSKCFMTQENLRIYERRFNLLW